VVEDVKINEQQVPWTEPYGTVGCVPDCRGSARVACQACDTTGRQVTSCILGFTHSIFDGDRVIL